MMAPLAEMMMGPLSPVHEHFSAASELMKVDLVPQASSSTIFPYRVTQQKLPQVQQAKPSGKQVTFSRKVSYREIPHLNNMTEEDVSYVWYSPEDYQLFRAVCKVTVKMMMKLGNENTEQYDPDLCCRGLVSKFPFLFCAIEIFRRIFRKLTKLVSFLFSTGEQNSRRCNEAQNDQATRP